MNIDDLIQYVSQESVLIGSRMGSRAFLLIGLRHIDLTFKNNATKFKKLSLHNELFSLNHFILNHEGYWCLGLYGACQGNNLDLAIWMIVNGANSWDHGLEGACRGGHEDLVEWMIERGVHNWNWGLEGACLGGHQDLVELMILKGANTCDYCFKTIAGHLI